MRKRNWREYNKKLVQRGSITFWIDPNFLQNTRFQKNTKGRPKFLSSFIHMGWIIKIVYKLTFRSLEGYLKSLFELLKISQSVPHYSLFCKRGKKVAELLPKLSSRKPLEIAIDASGLKIYGKGEWKTHIHGREKSRRWIKVHVAIDVKSQECIGLEITTDKEGDASMGSSLIRQCPKSVKRGYLDGAYDTITIRKECFEREIEEIIPPRKTGVLRGGKELENRNTSIKEIKGLGGDVSLWKKLKGYGKRSLSETFFSRLKMIYGERLRSKKFEHQVLETRLRVHSLNAMRR